MDFQKLNKKLQAAGLELMLRNDLAPDEKYARLNLAKKIFNETYNQILQTPGCDKKILTAQSFDRCMKILTNKTERFDFQINNN